LVRDKIAAALNSKVQMNNYQPTSTLSQLSPPPPPT